MQDKKTLEFVQQLMITCVVLEFGLPCQPISERKKGKITNENILRREVVEILTENYSSTKPYL